MKLRFHSSEGVLASSTRVIIVKFYSAMIDENEQLFQVVSIMDLKIFFGGSKTFDFELQLILKNHPRQKAK